MCNTQNLSRVWIRISKSLEHFRSIWAVLSFKIVVALHRSFNGEHNNKRASEDRVKINKTWITNRLETRWIELIKEKDILRDLNRKEKYVKHLNMKRGSLSDAYEWIIKSFSIFRCTKNIKDFFSHSFFIPINCICVVAADQKCYNINGTIYNPLKEWKYT